MCFGLIEQAERGVTAAIGSQRYELFQFLQTQTQVGSPIFFKLVVCGPVVTGVMLFILKLSLSLVVLNRWDW